ncbi:hypothetical protein [Stratiformator vulcanicus]|uniref:Secreted protein n=1 Tax=Stratiformator vulcanicus TaxID=2527980 RepID=A0A517R025_9PLAN|nr:hypothetical protein [Stratiformator vulcanicus]QDT37218.1 hypothetical protein Pan189_15900 [Stratiformator vulcanicus]
MKASIALTVLFGVSSFATTSLADDRGGLIALSQIKSHAAAMCQVAAPYQGAPVWQAIHRHAVEIAQLAGQAEQAILRRDALTVRAIGERLEDLGECIEDDAEDLDDWRCPRTLPTIYDAHVEHAERIAECIEDNTDKFRRYSRRVQFAPACPISQQPTHFAPPQQFQQFVPQAQPRQPQLQFPQQFDRRNRFQWNQGQGFGVPQPTFAPISQRQRELQGDRQRNRRFMVQLGNGVRFSF